MKCRETRSSLPFAFPPRREHRIMETNREDGARDRIDCGRKTEKVRRIASGELAYGGRDSRDAHEGG